ncbi:MAG: helix-turn-helix domain-containing protein [Candidatus Korarchaeota archaeon NZ13-K]|nr:MAG: helix-turn-helix domain-containing protein [Candidatus Korarchaeota archaeon NZ13-K]
MKLKRALRAVESENQVLRKRLEDLRALVEEVSKSVGVSISPEPVSATGSESVEDPELKRRILEIRVLNLYRQGVSVKDIVRQTGLSRSTVYRILKKYRESKV